MKDSHVEELIGNLYELIEDTTRMPGGYCMLNRDKLLDLVDEIKNNLPVEVQKAKEIVEKRDAVVEVAEKEAAKIKAQAEELAKQRVNENAITVEARNKANKILDDANKQKTELTRMTVDYCNDAMRRAEEAIAQVEKEIKISIAQFKQAVNDRR